MATVELLGRQFLARSLSLELLLDLDLVALDRILVDLQFILQLLDLGSSRVDVRQVVDKSEGKLGFEGRMGE